MRTAGVLAERWGLKDPVALTGGCQSAVLSDRELVVKTPYDPLHGHTEGYGLIAYQTTGVFPEVLDFDDETGSLLIPYIEGIHPQVIDRIDDIAAAMRHIRAAPETAPVVDRAWPRLGAQVHPHLYETFIWAVRRQPPADSSDRMIWCHGDLWHQNIIESADGSLVFIDPVIRWGSELSEAAELAGRTIAYQCDDYETVLDRVSAAYEVDRERLRLAAGLFSVVNASFFRHSCDIARMGQNLKVADLLLFDGTQPGR